MSSGRSHGPLAAREMALQQWPGRHFSNPNFLGLRLHAEIPETVLSAVFSARPGRLAAPAFLTWRRIPVGQQPGDSVKSLRRRKR